jgi:23S rRNA (adenine2503-C2)-methyltransferase
MKDIKRFSDSLFEAGYSAPIRQSRGSDILAACGQLKSDSERSRCSRLKARIDAGIPDEHHPDASSFS